MWTTENQMNKGHYSSVEHGLYLATIKGEVTIIMQHKEAAGTEVTVEFDEDLISGGGHTVLHGVAAELTDLRRGLVGSVPDTDAERWRESGLWGLKEWREEEDRQREQMIYEQTPVITCWDQRVHQVIPKQCSGPSSHSDDLRKKFHINQQCQRRRWVYVNWCCSIVLKLLPPAAILHIDGE